MGRKFGLSFSWKRAVGISGAKARISRKIGIPLTRSGRERKLGRMMTGGQCFVATACCGDAEHPTVLRLRRFRDEVLRHSRTGRAFIGWYYRRGPRIAAMIAGRPCQRQVCKAILGLAAATIEGWLLEQPRLKPRAPHRLAKMDSVTWEPVTPGELAPPSRS